MPESELHVPKGRNLVGRIWRKVSRHSKSHSRTPSGVSQISQVSSPIVPSSPGPAHSPAPSISQNSMDTTVLGESLPTLEPDVADSSPKAAPKEAPKLRPVETPKEAPKKNPISLWDQAYDALRRDNAPLVDDYEDLMSRALQQSEPKSQAPTRAYDEKQTSNIIAQNDVVERSKQLQKVIKLGSERFQSTKISTTIIGHEIVLQEVIAGAGNALDWASGYINDMLADVPYGPAVAAGVSLILPLLRNPTVAEEANREGLVYVTSQMKFYNMLETFLPDVNQEMKDDFTERVRDLYQRVIEFQLESVIRFYRSRTRNYFAAVSSYDQWESKRLQIEKDEGALKEKLNTGFAVKSSENLEALAKQSKVAEQARESMMHTLDGILGVMQRMDRQFSTVEDRRCLKALNPSDPKDDKVRIQTDKGGLLWGEPSFKWISENSEFQQWRDGENEQLLWIKGDPGKGKTMLMCGVTDDLIKSVGSAGNVAFFFCQEPNNQINTATSVLRGLIYMLVKQQTALFPILRNSFNDLGDTRFEGKNALVALSRVFEAMIQSPLLQTTYLVVDGLDECVEDLNQLLQLIKFSLSSNPKVKWIVASRNLRKLETEFRAMSPEKQLSLELNGNTVSDAVKKFVKIKVDHLSAKHNYDKETKAAVSSKLINDSEDTFLWVALVCKELEDAPRFKAKALSAGFPKGLDPLYNLMTQRIIRTGYADTCFQVLSAVVIARQPLNIAELSTIVDLPELGDLNVESSLRDIIGDCGSLLTWGKAGEVLFVHQTAKEYLMRERAADIFPYGVADAHLSIFSKSMQAMNDTLHYNMCDLQDRGYPIDDLTMPESDELHPVKYSCLHWADHLVMGEFNGSGSEYGELELFFQSHYLHWLESLALLKGIPQGASSMLKLDEFLTSRNNADSLTTLTHDASRFIQNHQRIIEQNPLQAYTSALLFSPTGSAIRSQYADSEPKWVTSKPLMDDAWTACVSTLSGHSGAVQSLALSRYGKLASVSYDGMVRIWDPSSGVSLMSFGADKTPISSVKWIRNETLATVSTDGTVRLWDTSSEQAQQINETKDILSLKLERRMTPNCRSTPPPKSQIQGIQYSLESFVSVAWSQNGKLALAAEDGAVYTWNCTNNRPPVQLGNHGSPVTSLEWSGDDRLATAGSNGSISIWNTSKRTRMIPAHNQAIFSVAWFKDRITLASVSTGSTIKIWNTKTGELHSSFEGGSNHIRSLAWSADGRLAGVDDNKIKIWRPSTGQCLSELEGHTHRIWSLVWLADGKRLASASRDRSIKVWDVSSQEVTSPVPCHDATVNTVAWSPDRTRLASASLDGTIKIWDASNGEFIMTLTGHTDSVVSLAWSGDGFKLVSGSKDTTLVIWDASSGDLISKIEGHTGSVSSVIWSTDDSKLASASEDKSIKIWDAAAQNASPLLTLETHTGPVSSVVWSSDNQKLASVSHDQTMKIWNATEGTCVLDQHSESYFGRPVAWSQDGKMVVTASAMGRTLQIWDFTQSSDSPASSTIDVNQEISWLQFDSSEAYHLHTSAGTFDLDPQSVAEASGSIRPVGYGIDGNTNWITWRSEKQLAIPQEISIACSAILPDRIAIGCSSGKVLIFGVDEDGPDANNGAEFD